MTTTEAPTPTGTARPIPANPTPVGCIVSPDGYADIAIQARALGIRMAITKAGHGILSWHYDMHKFNAHAAGLYRP